MRIITALRRGREAMASREFANGALFQMRNGDKIGEVKFEDVHDIRGRRNSVVGVCALGALYLGLVESKKSFSLVEDLVPEAAEMLAIGVLLSEGPSAIGMVEELYEEDLYDLADAHRIKREGPTPPGGYYRYPEGQDVAKARSELDFETWAVNAVKSRRLNPFEIIPEFNDESDSKQAVLDAFDAAIEYAGRCGL